MEPWGCLAAAGAVVPLQGYRCPDSTKAARNHPKCASATAATQPAAASQSSIPDWSAGLGADGSRNGACADSVMSTSLTYPLQRKSRDETFRLQHTSRMSRQDGTYRLLSSPVLRPSRRRESSRRATLDAALALLRADGYGAMTIERIAARAGVGKQTIYRWWPSKGAVVFEALLEDLRVSLTFDDTGDLRADLTTQVTSLSRVFASPDGRHMAALIGGAQGDPDLAQALLEHWVRPRRRYAMAFLQQAKDRGQLRPDLDLEVGIDIIWAPLYYRLLLHYAPLDDGRGVGIVERRVVQKQSVVQGRTDDVDPDLEVEVGPELATVLRLLQKGHGVPPARPYPVLQQRLGEVGVPLGATDEGGHVATVWRGEDPGQRHDLGGQVGPQIAGVVEGQADSQVLKQRLEDYRPLGRPPSVDRLLPHPGPGGDALDGHRPVAVRP